MKFIITSKIDKPIVEISVVNVQKNEYKCPRCSSVIIINDYFGRCKECRTEISGPLMER